MKILLLLSESWNDKLAPNNNMTNWFLDFPGAEIWTISGSSQIPENQCCKNYFLVGEHEIMKSIISGKVAGKTYYYKSYPISDVRNTPVSMIFKIKKKFAGEPARLIRDCVWRYGRYDIEAMKSFIQACNPDIVFTQRRGSVKMCRMESIVASLTNAPIVAYTGDDEYSLHQFSLSPFFWIRRFWVRKWLKKTIPMYKLFYSQSKRQMKEIKEEFRVPTKFLVKCGIFEERKIHREVRETIRLVYAGKLYCNRWKTLAVIAKSIEDINRKAGSLKLQLNIYTSDNVTKKQDRVLNDGKNSILQKAVPASELPKIYLRSDIVLHVESFDLKNKLLTQDSFSTKVMDCLASGCAVMAVCWEGHAAYQYLQEKDAAIVASSESQVCEQLKKLSEQPEIVIEYAEKAFKCGIENHQRQCIQKMIQEDFDKVINIC